MLEMIRMIILPLSMIISMGQDDGSWFMAQRSLLMAHGQGGEPSPGPWGAPGSGPDLEALQRAPEPRLP